MTVRHDLDTLTRELEGRMPLRASALLLTIFAVIFTTIVWSFLTEIDDVTRAQGKVVPAGYIQRVQASDGGVIREVYVAEGDTVEADAPLIALEGLVQNSQLDREEQKALSLRTRIIRLSAEIDGRDPVFPAELTAATPALVASARALHIGRAAEITAEINVLERRSEQRRDEQIEIQARLNSARRIAAILKEERAIIGPLVQKGVEPRTSLLTLLRRQEEEAGKIAQTKAALVRLDKALSEIDELILATRSRFRAEALRDLTDATAEFNGIRSALPALEGLAARTVLRAPTSGVVNRLLRRTIGSTVRGGEDVAEIVPSDNAMFVEAYVLPQDVAFLRPGLDVRIKLTAYDFTRYGTLDGVIERIGANAIRRDQRDDSEVFVVVVRAQGALQDDNGAEVEIIPGMTAEVDILAGRRRVIDYLLQPLEQTGAKAFRD